MSHTRIFRKPHRFSRMRSLNRRLRPHRLGPAIIAEDLGSRRLQQGGNKIPGAFLQNVPPHRMNVPRTPKGATFLGPGKSVGRELTVSRTLLPTRVHLYRKVIVPGGLYPAVRLVPVGGVCEVELRNLVIRGLKPDD